MALVVAAEAPDAFGALAVLRTPAAPAFLSWAILRDATTSAEA